MEGSFFLSWVFLLPKHHTVLTSKQALEYDNESMPFSVKRALRGSSQAWGQLSVVVKNHGSTFVQALYLETMPWLIQFHLHTLQARVDGKVQGRYLWVFLSIETYTFPKTESFRILATYRRSLTPGRRPSKFY